LVAVHSRPLFTTSAPATIVFWATCAVWVAAELRQSRRTRADAVAEDRGSRTVIAVCGAAAWFVASFAERNLPGTSIDHRAVWMVVAMLVMWSGIALRFWAMHVLGKYFTFTVMTSGAQEVVSRGPYRLIRHPGYAGAALAFLGLGVMLGNWVSVAALVVLPAVGYVNRIRVEEAALHASLGDRYRAYAEGRKRLLPYVW
jgi:protein-S-isoprenylcysteine O-methyltransferase Ste14